MKKNNLILSVSTLALFAMLITSTNAANLNSDKLQKNINPLHLKIKSAIENNDYDSFKEIIASNPKSTDIPTQEIFSKLVEANNLKKSGDILGAKKIISSIDIKKNGKQFKRRGSFYWNLTEEQKAIFDDARELRKEGKNEEAKKILIDANIKEPIRINK